MSCVLNLPLLVVWLRRAMQCGSAASVDHGRAAWVCVTRQSHVTSFSTVTEKVSDDAQGSLAYGVRRKGTFF